MDEVFRDFQKIFDETVITDWRNKAKIEHASLSAGGQPTKIEVAVPGLTADDLSISFNGSVVKISTTSVKSSLFSSKEIVLSGCNRPSFKATVSNGLLTILVTNQPLEVTRIVPTDLK